MSEQRRISHPKERLSSTADTLWTQACSKDRWLGTTEDLEHGIRRVSDASLSRTSHGVGAGAMWEDAKVRAPDTYQHGGTRDGRTMLLG